MFLDLKSLVILNSIVTIAVSQTLVAYRVVGAALAEKYIQNGNTLVVDPDSSSSDQLGPGVYTSPIAGDWYPTQGKYVCAIYADTTKWNLANKAWVPAKVTANFDTPSDDDEGCIPTWWMGTGAVFARSKYLTQIGGSGFTTDNTILLSQIDMGNGPNTKLQMLIPTALVGSKNPLGIRTECVKFDQSAGNNGADSYASINKGEIAWSSWTNVKGVAQAPEPET
ncbi:hypothetical protein BD289DRAFT_454851 [Coniella lustricola]|uniref:Uncharacterized protein n=1 Tax=Coniella lustricola TaxID=2025994 RepID=A0A2T3A1W7_9PEZI|nr:hypothetical protein BD289DRAFT_454851 [Coniella lustricola]